MGPLALFALLSGLLLTSVMGSNDEDPVETPDEPEEPDTPEEPDLPEEPVTPEEPDEPLDTGASFSRDGDTVELELGEDETGSLAVFYYTDTEDRADPADWVEVSEARFYLVPDSVDWSDADWASQSDIPIPTGADTDSPDYYYAPLLADFEADHGLELLGVVDLLANPDALAGGIVSNAPVTGYIVEANTDGDDLIKFLPEDAPETRNGVEETPVTENTTGTEGSDWLTTTTDNIALDGAGGHDVLESTGFGASLTGGDGSDRIFIASLDPVEETEDDSYYYGDDRLYVGSGTASGGDGNDTIYGRFSGTAYGGDGDDWIDGLAEGTAYGGQGNDRLTDYGSGKVVFYGEEGNDSVTASGAESEAHGGVGDDNIGANNGATGFGGIGDDFVAVNGISTGYGGVGNDHIQLDSGSTGFGGDGDDLFRLYNFFGDADGTATATGGAGVDTYEVTARNAAGGAADDTFLRITDFDPAEDVLEVIGNGPGEPVRDVEIVQDPDGAYTDVRVTYANRYDQEPGVVVIRLDGMPAITLDHIITA